jgi:predicted RNA polymerase sigma factor
LGVTDDESVFEDLCWCTSSGCSQKDLELYLEARINNAPHEDDEIEDDRLRLIFTCCHPALTPEAQVALTFNDS